MVNINLSIFLAGFLQSDGVGVGEPVFDHNGGFILEVDLLED